MGTFTVDLLTGRVYLFNGDFTGSGSTPTSGSTYSQVNVYSSLPSAGSASGSVYLVRTGSGTTVLDRKPAGLYYSTGSVWRYLGDTPDGFLSNNFQILDSADTSKSVSFQTSGITSGTNRILKIQNSDGTIAYLTDLNTKVDVSVFNDYTGTTAPSLFLPITGLTGYWNSGETVSWVNNQGFLTSITSTGTHVDINGSDTNGDGTINNPYQTLQKGINETTSGDTVIILGDGTFSENVTSKFKVDIYAPNATLELNNGNQLILNDNKVTFRRLLRTSGDGNMVVADNNTGYSILVAYEINDTGSGNTLININSAPMDISFSQAYVGNGQSFLIDDSTGRHVHLRGEDIYLTASGSTAVSLTNGGTVLMTVHHTKELGTGISNARVFNIVNGDINASFQEVSASILADISSDGNLNIVAQDAAGIINNIGGVYTRFLNQYNGKTEIGSNLSLLLDSEAYKLIHLSGYSGSFLTLGDDGLIIPTSIDVGTQTWTDNVVNVTNISATSEFTIYNVTVDENFTAGNIEFKVDMTQPYYRNTTIRIYSGATLIDTQTYAGAISPLQFIGAYPISYSVPSGSTFSVTLQSSVGGAYAPNNTTVLDTGFLKITKTGNQATPSWGSITGDITTQTDLYDAFLAKNNITIYTPTNLYHPATKKYVDDADNLKANLSGATFTGNVKIDKFIKRSTTPSIIASTTQSQGQQQLITDINEISTVNATNDVVTLPSAEAGLEILIINNGANTLQIYPASGDNLGAGINISTTLVAGNVITFVAYNNTNWIIK